MASKLLLGTTNAFSNPRGVRIVTIVTIEAIRIMYYDAVYICVLVNQELHRMVVVYE